MAKIRNTKKDVQENPIIGLFEAMDIEGSERRGQSELTRSSQLPYNCTGSSSWNRPDYADVVNEYAKHGIEVIQESEGDELFVDVKMPEGWKIVSTGHVMWSDLVDANGKKRASMFYKAAFYDRGAHLNFKTRYKCDITSYLPQEETGHYETHKVKRKVKVDPLKGTVAGNMMDIIGRGAELFGADIYHEFRDKFGEVYEEKEFEEKVWIHKYEDSYEEYNNTPIYVEVKDGDTVLFSTKDEPFFYTRKYDKDTHQEWWSGREAAIDSIRQKGVDFLNKNYPNWKDSSAYF